MPRCGIIRGFCPRRINKKGNGCCLFMAEGFALQRLPIGNAEGTIACSPDMPRCGIIRGFCPHRINKKATGVAFYGGRRGIRLTAIADRECQGHNRVQPGYAAVRHYSGVLPSPDKQKRQRVLPFYGGRRGIRTPGYFRINGFQDRRFRPLSQPSVPANYIIKTG